MNPARKLPAYLVNRFRGWRATDYNDNKSWFLHLAQEGQHPRTLLIACCDSRVHVTAIFGADQGEFFIHRNIANLVPPFSPNGDYHGTSATVEYAVSVLKVAHLIVVGHSNCGGVQGCHDMCAGHAPELSTSSSRTRCHENAGSGLDGQRQSSFSRTSSAFEHVPDWIPRSTLEKVARSETVHARCSTN